MITDKMTLFMQDLKNSCPGLYAIANAEKSSLNIMFIQNL